MKPSTAAALLLMIAAPARAGEWSGDCPEPTWSWNPLNWAAQEAAAKGVCAGLAPLRALMQGDPRAIEAIRAQGPGNPAALLSGIPGLQGAAPASPPGAAQPPQVPPVLDGSATR